MTTFMGSHRSINTQTHVPVPMRDGAILYADVYRPDTSEKVPVVLQRTPYNKTLPGARTGTLDAVRAASHGFAVVIQDTRGRFDSEGEFYPFRDEMNDGYDTVEWCASQPWSSGKVGMYGRSYIGATQWLAAMSRPQALSAMVPAITASDYYDGWTYQGGALEWGFAVSWSLSQLTLANLARISRDKSVPPDTASRLVNTITYMEESLRTLPTKDFPHLKDGLAPYFYDWLDHSRLDDYWKRWRVEDHYGEITVPALHVGGWFDIFLKGTLRNFQGMKNKGPTEMVRGGQKLVIGPWSHTAIGLDVAGETYFGVMAADAAIDLQGLHLRWYDYWLKGIDNGVMDEPPVRIFIMGDNTWRHEDEWPLRRTNYVNYYFRSEGKANTLNGNGTLSTDAPGDEPPDFFTYDPKSPVPSKGGPLCCSPGLFPGGAFDQHSIEARPDVLVYTSAALTEDLEVTGPVTVTLYAASSASDTDFTGKLVDVSPCGCASSLIDGIIRARYRDSLAAPELIEPGNVYQYTIDLVATSNVFKAGHLIRVEISSSNFPRFDRNPNTGREPREEQELMPALQTIFHSNLYPSHITLPVIPRG